MGTVAEGVAKPIQDLTRICDKILEGRYEDNITANVSAQAICPGL